MGEEKRGGKGSVGHAHNRRVHGLVHHHCSSSAAPPLHSCLLPTAPMGAWPCHGDLEPGRSVATLGLGHCIPPTPSWLTSPQHPLLPMLDLLGASWALLSLAVAAALGTLQVHLCTSIPDRVFRFGVLMTTASQHLVSALSGTLYMSAFCPHFRLILQMRRLRLRERN